MALPPQSPMIWDGGQAPRSRLYGDIYFSKDDGLAESRAVFLAGCGLPGAWRDRERFCVAELGFGAGLNIAALLDLWDRTRAPGQRLSVFSVEAHLVDASDAARALAAWPEISSVAKLLASRWPERARGFHRIDLPQLGVGIDVAVMEATDALTAWSGAADAWFLDGFSPALNPAMWRPELLALVTKRSAPGARAASYSVAGDVRRALTAGGFTVERKAGFGEKRQRLEARLPSTPGQAPAATPRVAVIGAGVAGAALARAFSDQGMTARVFDARGPGAGASGLPAALVMPRLDAGLGPQAELFANALRRARALYGDVPKAVISHQAIQFQTGPKDAARFAAIAASDLFQPGAMAQLTATEVSARLGEVATAGLLVAQAVVIEPFRVLDAWLGHAHRACVASLTRDQWGWRLADGDGALLCQADIVCIAAGMASARLAAGLPLTPVRGQASWSGGGNWPISTVFGGYAIPMGGGVLFGATHDREDEGADCRIGDDARNLKAVTDILPGLGARLAGAPLRSWAAVRATTRDYLPLAGAAPAAPAGLFVLAGLGSRGFTLAPLLAEHIAALALGAPSPLANHLAALVEPGRFAKRALRRGGPAHASAP